MKLRYGRAMGDVVTLDRFSALLHFLAAAERPAEAE
jgi:hypothetical protein